MFSVSHSSGDSVGALGGPNPSSLTSHRGGHCCGCCFLPGVQGSPELVAGTCPLPPQGPRGAHQARSHPSLPFLHPPRLPLAAHTSAREAPVTPHGALSSCGLWRFPSTTRVSPSQLPRAAPSSPSRRGPSPALSSSSTKRFPHYYFLVPCVGSHFTEEAAEAQRG